MAQFEAEQVVHNPAAVRCTGKLEATQAKVAEGLKHVRMAGVDSPATERVFDITKEGVAVRPAEQKRRLLVVGR